MRGDSHIINQQVYASLSKQINKANLYKILSTYPITTTHRCGLRNFERRCPYPVQIEMRDLFQEERIFRLLRKEIGNNTHHW